MAVSKPVSAVITPGKVDHHEEELFSLAIGTSQAKSIVVEEGFQLSMEEGIRLSN